jgi:hypothetical protein
MAEQRFWADPQLEPKRNFRWILNMNGVPEFVIKKVTKPSFEITEAKHEFLIHTFYYPGRLTWNEVSITLADPVQPDSSQRMVDNLERAGYRIPTDPGVIQTMAKAPAVDALGQVTLRQIDAEGNDIERWILVNSWIKSVNFGELAYDNDEIVNIELKIRYDFAEKEL